MSASQTYWYNLTTQTVVRDDERPSPDCLGPFGSAAEAEDSPAVLVEFARTWLESEESAPYREMAAELGDDIDRA